MLGTLWVSLMLVGSLDGFLHGLTLTSLFPAGFDTVRSFSLSLAWL